MHFKLNEEFLAEYFGKERANISMIYEPVGGPAEDTGYLKAVRGWERGGEWEGIFQDKI